MLDMARPSCFSQTAMSEEAVTDSPFDRARRRIGLVLGPAVLLTILFVPTGLTPEAHRLAAVFALVIVFWVTEAIPLAATALLGPALCVPLGIATHREAFAAFGSPIIFLFLGSFLIARGMTLHGLDRRIALSVLSLRWVGESPHRILLAFGGIAAFLSMWISNTATTAMMLPIGLGVLRSLSNDETALPGKPVTGYGTGLMLMIAFSCSLGGMATPVGTPPNLIAVGMFEKILGREIGFFDWMRLGLPLAVACFFLLFLVIRLQYVRGKVAMEGATEKIRRQRQALGSLGTGEKSALAVFVLVVCLWVLPSLLVLTFGPNTAAGKAFSALKGLLPEAVSAILAGSLLFILPGRPKRGGRSLAWKDAVGIDWGTILLFGGGLSLGSLAFSTGLAEALGGAVKGWGAELGVAPLSLLALFTANIMTEFMSNTAMANLLVPTVLAIGEAQATPTMVPALATTLGCSLAFCLPVATPPNAIVYGSGHVTLLQMIRTGILLDLCCGLLVWAGLLLLAPMLGF